jgi:hypothetical protein
VPKLIFRAAGVIKAKQILSVKAGIINVLTIKLAFNVSLAKNCALLASRVLNCFVSFALALVLTR